MVRPTFTRAKEQHGYYSKGKHAVGICHRSGFKYLLSDLVFEPGTNYLVHRSESDGMWSEVAHPQNYSAEVRADNIALRWTSPDVDLSVGTVVSAEALYLPVYACVCNHWIIVPEGPAHTSSGSGVSVSLGAGVSSGTRNLDFSQPNNSMYLIVVFPGI